MSTKVCTRCNTEKPIAEFYRRGPAKAVQCWCKECKRAYRKEHDTRIRDAKQSQNRAPRTPKQVRELAVKAVHRTGISATNFRCAVCSKVADEFHHWSYADDHRLLVVPLCFSCHRRNHRGTLGVTIGKEHSINLQEPHHHEPRNL